MIGEGSKLISIHMESSETGEAKKTKGDTKEGRSILELR